MKSLIRKICLLLFGSVLFFSPTSIWSQGYKFIDGTLVRNSGVPHLDTAIAYLHVREKTGKNDGVYIDMFHRSVGLKNPRTNGYPYCASFVSYALKVTNNQIVKVRSARALAFATKDMIPIVEFLRKKYILKPGDIIVFRQGQTAFGHVEIGYMQVVEKFYAIGANTSNGSKVNRDGQGVFPTIRRYQPFANLKIIGILRGSK